MQTYAACTASVVLSVGATYWYKYCLRIYNRCTKQPESCHHLRHLTATPGLSSSSLTLSGGILKAGVSEQRLLHACAHSLMCMNHPPAHLSPDVHYTRRVR